VGSLSGLSHAAFEGDLDGVLRFLGCGADPNEGSPLLLAAGRGWESVVKTLLAAGANPNAVGPEGLTPLWAAVFSRNGEILRGLLVAGAAVDMPSAPGALTALMHSARAGFVEGMLLLLRSGADVNARSPKGFTALSVAVSANQPEAVALLIAHGADVEKGPPGEFTPLTVAARRGYLGVLELLLKAGADPNRVIVDGWSALAIAAYQGHTAQVRALLNASANPNSQDASGRTPLMWASWRGFPHCYRRLIQGGADVSLRATTKAEPRSAPNPAPVVRRRRPLGISLLRRLALEMLWMVANRTRVWGIPVGLCILPSREAEAALSALDAAFRLIQAHDQRTLSHIKRAFRRIVIHRLTAPPAMLIPAANWCVLRWPHPEQGGDVAIRLASSLIHEVTHSRLIGLRFGYSPSDRQRIERVCIKASLSFVKRLPNAAQTARALHNLLDHLSPKMLADSDRRSHIVGVLPTALG